MGSSKIPLTSTTLRQSLLLLLLLVQLISGAFSKSSKNAAAVKREAEIEECGAKNREIIEKKLAKLVVIGENGRVYPENRRQLKTFCAETTNLLADIDRHIRHCYRGTSFQQFALLFIYSNRVTTKRYCGGLKSKSKSKSKNENTNYSQRIEELFGVARCANRNRRSMSRCMSRLIRRFVGIKHTADDRKKIPYVCCEYVRLTECFIDAFSDGRGKARQNSCESQTERMQQFLHGVTGNFVDSSCGEFTADSDRCAALGSPPSALQNETIPLTMLRPLFEIIDSSGVSVLPA